MPSKKWNSRIIIKNIRIKGNLELWNFLSYSKCMPSTFEPFLGAFLSISYRKLRGLIYIYIFVYCMKLL